MLFLFKDRSESKCLNYQSLYFDIGNLIKQGLQLCLVNNVNIVCLCILRACFVLLYGEKLSKF